MVDFHGWELPIQFAGIVKEHQHTRQSVSIFDCSHMGEFRVRGADAIVKYNTVVCSDVEGLKEGRCRYGAVLNEDGGIVDDVITFRLGPEELYVVSNAGPLDRISGIITRDNPGAEDVSSATAKIDVQGPSANGVMDSIGLGDCHSLKYYQAKWTAWKGKDLVCARLGYTGELGYELYIPNDVAEPLWNAILEVEGVQPAGLGARDTLRTEMGFALSGQDFNEDNTPLEIGIAALVHWEGSFTGIDALERQRDRNDYLLMTGVVSPDRRAPRHDFAVKNDGRDVGVVTSGTFGPSLGVGVGLAYLPQDLRAPGTPLTAGPKDIPIRTAAIPMYDKGTSRK